MLESQHCVLTDKFCLQICVNTTCVTPRTDFRRIERSARIGGTITSRACSPVMLIPPTPPRVDPSHSVSVYGTRPTVRPVDNPARASAMTRSSPCVVSKTAEWKCLLFRLRMLGRAMITWKVPTLSPIPTVNPRRRTPRVIKRWKGLVLDWRRVVWPLVTVN